MYGNLVIYFRNVLDSAIFVMEQNRTKTTKHEMQLISGHRSGYGHGKLLVVVVVSEFVK